MDPIGFRMGGFGSQHGAERNDGGHVMRDDVLKAGQEIRGYDQNNVGVGSQRVDQLAVHCRLFEP